MTQYCAAQPRAYDVFDFGLNRDEVLEAGVKAAYEPLYNSDGFWCWNYRGIGPTSLRCGFLDATNQIYIYGIVDASRDRLHTVELQSTQTDLYRALAGRFGQPHQNWIESGMSRYRWTIDDVQYTVGSSTRRDWWEVSIVYLPFSEETSQGVSDKF